MTGFSLVAWGLAGLAGIHLWLMWRISGYHQRVLKVKPGTALYPAVLGLLAVGLAGSLILPAAQAQAVTEMLLGTALYLCGVHLAHNMLLK